MNQRKTLRTPLLYAFSIMIALSLGTWFCTTQAYADKDDTSGTPAKTGWVAEGDDWFYFSKSGVMTTGWQKVGGKWYYLDPSDGKMLTGKHSIDGTTYFLTVSGAMKTGWSLEDGTWYYYKSSGAMKTGWIKLSGKWYYLDPADGKMLTGKHSINDATYFLTSSGAMKTGWNKEDGTWFYYKSSGAMQTGWLKTGGKWYYLDPSDGKMLTGKYKVDGVWYISNDSGAMHANKWVQLSEGWYYPDKSGALKSGWLKTGGKWYWLQPDQDCLMLASATKTIDGALYSFTSSGAMQANCQVKLDNNDCGYAASSGAITKIGTFNGDKVILKDAQDNTLTGWQKLAGKWFYANADGVMQSGWVSDAGKWYWLGSDGAMATNAWVDGGKYYVGANGVWVQANITQDMRAQFAHGPKTAKHQKYIVLHDTEGGGTPQNVIAGWASNGRQVAAHFVIGKDGSIVQCVPLDQIAHHAGYGNKGHNAKFGVPEDGRDDMRGTTPIGSYCPDYGMNSYSIGIELIHRGSSGEAYPKAQLEALDKLIAYIDSYYGFQSTIIDHKTWRIGNSDTSKEFAGYLANYRDHRSYK